MHLFFCAHHCKISATCPQGALGTWPKDTEVNESVDVGVLLRFFCVVCSRVYLLATVCVSACVHGCQPGCVGTLKCFHVAPRNQNRVSGMTMVMVTFFQIYLFVQYSYVSKNRSVLILLTHEQPRARTHTHTDEQLALINTRTRTVDISLHVCSEYESN